MKPIKLQEGLWAVYVPADANGFYFSNSTTKYLSFNYKCHVDNIELGFSTLSRFEILGTVTQDSISFDAEDFVKPSIDLPEYKYGGELHPKETYWDYEIKSFWIDSSDDSFRSLLSSKGLTDYEKIIILKEL